MDNISSEINIRKCKDCGNFKQRILVGKWDDKNKKWVDESGKPWNGNRCGLCHVEKMKSNMRLKRDTSKI